MRKHTTVLGLAGWLCLRTLSAWAQAPANLALGRPYTLDPAPNYALCQDEGDATQLTDGVRLAGPAFWTEMPAVGWSVAQPVSITVDLGQVEPIAGVALSTAAGHGGVEWPWSIVILVSDDGQTWYRAGDLARLDRQEPVNELTRHEFRTDRLRTRGRYARFLVGKLGYTFADEVEVYRGDDAWLQQPPAETSVSANMDEVAREAQGVNAMLERLRADLQEARAAITASRLTDAGKRDLLGRAEGLAGEVEALPDALPPGFRTIMPFSDLQARIFALHAPVRRAAGYGPLLAWAANRWDNLQPTEAPAELPATAPALRVDMMRREHRATALNLTNSTDTTMDVAVRLTALPDGDNPAYVSVREVLFSDTYVRYPIAAALPEARRAEAGYQVSIPAGMTKQVWLDFSPRTTEPGEYAGQVRVTAAGVPEIVAPLTLRLYPLDFPDEYSLALGGWDYSEGPASAFDGAVVDQKTFLAKLQECGVNLAWAAGFVKGAQFDAEGNMTAPPDFSAWDAWVAKWPRARYFATFGLSSDIQGADPATPVFRRRVVQWLQAMAAHLQETGMRPEQYLVLAVDEPRGPEFDAEFLPWGEAFREANTGIRLFEDPCHEDPVTADPRLYELSDVLCPSGARFIGSPPSYRDFFARLREGGKELWFYNCVNGKHLDPITYHRGTIWLAIQQQARGVGFWAFGDEGRSGGSFVAYTSPGHMFSPLFLDPGLGVMDGKHMAAIREGTQDYEYFVMLRARVADLEARGIQAPALDTAHKLLRDGPDRVARDITIENLDWRAPKARSAMDEVRVEVLEALTALGGL
jgi:hypothetical protein